MMPATWPRSEPLDEKLLVLESDAGRWHDAQTRDLKRWLVAGDLLVVNDAATLPASLRATAPGGTRVEVRLAARLHVAGDRGEARECRRAICTPAERWRAVLFGDGDWRLRTEDRPPPPSLEPGAELSFDDAFFARVESVDPRSQRLVELRFSLEGAALWGALYRLGRPVQYAHVTAPLELWHTQTPFASRPWSVEMPSAGRPLAWSLLSSLRAAGVRVAALTHAAGLSSTGDPAVDAILPMPERFDIPESTVRAVVSTRAEGGRVIAVGTTVVRALEGCAAMHGGELVPGEGTTDLRIGETTRLRVVDGLLTGLHEVGTSHRELLRAFAPEPLLRDAWAHASASGYLGHEFGDACLVLRRS
jgi:S-adenosylmethionine:tRNA ribosyltransferase-isomerase